MSKFFKYSTTLLILNKEIFNLSYTYFIKVSKIVLFYYKICFTSTSHPKTKETPIFFKSFESIFYFSIKNYKKLKLLKFLFPFDAHSFNRFPDDLIRILLLYNLIEINFFENQILHLLKGLLLEIWGSVRWIDIFTEKSVPVKILKPQMVLEGLVRTIQSCFWDLTKQLINEISGQVIFFVHKIVRIIVFRT